MQIQYGIGHIRIMGRDERCKGIRWTTSGQLNGSQMNLELRIVGSILDRIFGDGDGCREIARLLKCRAEMFLCIGVSRLSRNRSSRRDDGRFEVFLLQLHGGQIIEKRGVVFCMTQSTGHPVFRLLQIAVLKFDNARKVQRIWLIWIERQYAMIEFRCDITLTSTMFVDALLKELLDFYGSNRHDVTSQGQPAPMLR